MIKNLIPPYKLQLNTSDQMLTANIHINNKTINNICMPNMGSSIPNKNYKISNDAKQIS